MCYDAENHPCEKARIIAEVVSFISFSIDLPELYAQKKGRDIYDIVEKNIAEFFDYDRSLFF